MKLRVAVSKSILALTSVALATAGLVLPQSAPAATTDQRTFSPFGLNSHLTWGYGHALIDRELDSMARAGAHWVRFDMSWKNLEPARGSYVAAYFADIDYIVAGARSRGMECQPTVMATPAWANGGAGTWVPPTRDSDFANFMRYVAARYRGKITHWEIWNEPNIDVFWDPSPNAARYTGLLRAAYTGTKLGNPEAVVISAGLSSCDTEYLQKMYDAGARGYFDLLGVHPFSETRSPYYQSTSSNSQWNFDGIAEMRELMEANADPGKHIWISETGWHTGTRGVGVSEATQAQYVTEAYERMLAEFPYVDAMLIYTLRNNGTDLTDGQDNYGLLRNDFSAKPGYYAFQSAAKGFEVPVQPSITVAPETNPATYGQPSALNVGVKPAGATPVTIERRNSTTGQWEDFAAATTASNGTARIAVTPRTTAVYRATAPDKGLVSAAITWKVRAKATVKASRLSIRRNRTVRFGGKILPGVRTARAALQRKVGRRWVTVRKIATATSGAFSLRVRIGRRGKFAFRVRYYGNSSHLGTYSRPTPLRVY